MASKKGGKVINENIDGILSACRGMSHGMGIDIMYVEIGKAGDQKVNNNLISNANTNRTDRQHNKIEALTQTLADRLYLEGYELKKLDLRRMEPDELKGTEWSMRVCITD